MHMVVVLPFPPFWLLLLQVTACFLVIGALNEDGFALLNFKWSVREDPDGSLSNWNSSDPNPCSWNGITCRDEKVVAITIPRKKLLGSIPSALGSLSSLRHVNLRNNRLYGSLPSGFFFGATGLQSIVLYGNAISGPLPSTIGNLSFLQILDVSQNSLSWSIPISLLNCKRLKTLDLSQNNFTGPLPDGIGKSLGLLEKLDLSYNQFNGSIPSDIGNLSSLQGTLNLSHNTFSGSIPATLGNLPEKVYIDLTYNNLSGLIPQSGALMNRGPAAFIGNPGLCGTALKKPCSSSDESADVPSSFPYLPSTSSPPGKEIGNLGGDGGHKGLSTGAVIAIISSDVVGICVIALVFFCCYRRRMASRGKDVNGNSDQAEKRNKECLCFRRDESRTPSEAADQLDLIPLDRNVNFDLDELLKASAFVLGKSEIGIVYKVVLEDGLTLAVRRLGEGGSKRFKEFQAEVEAIGKIKHPNIVNLRAYYWSIDEKLLVYEYIPNGHLSDAIHGKAGMTFLPMPWLVRLNLVKGLAKGLSYLHEFSPKKYVHGDLKPSNILLGHDMEPYISDFGLGRLANIAGGSPVLQSNRIASEKQLSQSSDIVVSPMMGTTFCYQAPEAFKALKPSQKWDVYSYGVILLELITGRSPVVLLGNSDMDLVRWVQICIDEKKSLAEVLDPYLAGETETKDQIVAVLKIALACVQVNPERRPSMRHVLETLD